MTVFPLLVPSDAQRLAMRDRPTRAAVMFQHWRDLLFLHWRYSAEAIQATLPPGLHVDTHEGHAYLGVVPFVMRNVRPRFLPAVPGLSHFLELNLRTYVHDEAGVPGVWFYSLDADQRLAVAIARQLFHLPYESARMRYQRTPDGRSVFHSRRMRPAERQLETTLAWRPVGTPRTAVPGSLDFFLAERYRLFAHTPSGLRCGTVHHAPYPLCDAEVTTMDESLFALNGFTPTGRAPDHVVCSSGVDVSIYPLMRAGAPVARR